MSYTRGWRWSMCFVVIVGCGASSTQTVAPTADESATGNEGPTTDESANTPATSGFVIGSVSWEMFQPTRIDDQGNLFHGSSRLGVLTANGELIDEDGSVTARLAPDGTIQVGDRVSSLRLVGDGVAERDDPPFVRIEGSELLVGEGDELEHVALTGFRPELTREVLFVCAVVMDGMAHASAH